MILLRILKHRLMGRSLHDFVLMFDPVNAPAEVLAAIDETVRELAAGGQNSDLDTHSPKRGTFTP